MPRSGRYLEQPGDEGALSLDVVAADVSNLPLSHHRHRLNAGQRVPSAFVPLNWIERNDNGPRSGRFQNADRDDASVQETIAAGAGWEGSATA